MRQFGDVIKTGVVPAVALPSQQEVTLEKRHIDRLWRRMKKAFGPEWTRNFGDADDGTWLNGLQGLSPQQIALGITRCAGIKSRFPPALPVFRDLCAPTAKDVGMPAIDVAYREAYTNAERHRDDRAWSHPAVWLATRSVGFDAVFSSTTTREAFGREYARLIVVVAGGAALETPPLPVRHAPTLHHRQPISDVGRSALDTAWRMLGRARHE